MKHMIRSLVAVVLLACLSAVASAQTATTQTSLSAAVTSITQNTVTLASATGVSAGAELYVDREAMFVAPSYVSGTVVPVIRGQDSTTATLHAANALVFVASNATATQVFVYQTPSGVCTRGNMLNAPQVNVTTGEVIDCVNSMWASLRNVPQGAHVYPWAQVSQLNGLITATSAGYAVRPDDYIVALSTTSKDTAAVKAVNTIQLPTAAQFPGRIVIIKDETGAVTGTTNITITVASGNIDLASSFVIGTGNGSVTLYAGSGGWFTVACWSAGCR